MVAIFLTTFVLQNLKKKKTNKTTKLNSIFFRIVASICVFDIFPLFVVIDLRVYIL